MILMISWSLGELLLGLFFICTINPIFRMRSISPLVQRARLFSLLISLSLLSIVVGASLFSSLRYFSKDTVDVRKVLGMGYEHRFTSKNRFHLRFLRSRVQFSPVPPNVPLAYLFQVSWCWTRHSR